MVIARERSEVDQTCKHARGLGVTTGEGELGNLLCGKHRATLMTLIEIDSFEDPAVVNSIKCLGAAYAEPDACRLDLDRGWPARREESTWRRAVLSPTRLESSRG